MKNMTANLTAALLVGAMAAVSGPAAANVIYNFNAAGVTENVAQQGSVRFDFSNDGKTLTLTLANNQSPTADILAEISGLAFAFTDAPTAMTLTGVSAPLVVDCSNIGGPSCPAAGNSPANYGWGMTMMDGVMTLGAGYSNGAFGYQPYAIVNSNYLAPGAGGLSDPANNPLLVGPVTFTFALEGLAFAPELARVTFLFGDPIYIAAVPEPGSLALLGIGLLAAALVTRRVVRRRKS